MQYKLSPPSRLTFAFLLVVFFSACSLLSSPTQASQDMQSSFVRAGARRGVAASVRGRAPCHVASRFASLPRKIGHTRGNYGSYGGGGSGYMYGNRQMSTLAVNPEVTLSEIYTDNKAAGDATPVYLVKKGDEDAIKNIVGDNAMAFVKACKFEGGAGQICVIPGENGQVGGVLVGVDDGSEPLSLGLIPTKLASGTYKIESSGLGGTPATEANAAALAWGLGSYKFQRHKKPSDDDAGESKVASLVFPEGVDEVQTKAMVQGMFMARDLINQPANVMGPIELEEAAAVLSTLHNAKLNVISGPELESGYPMIYAVGRASTRPPRLVELRWGPESAPKVTLVGKGVVFDTGGLNIKPGSAMLPMKKDMGGAASIIGLAHTLMASKLNINLRVLLPIAENSIAGNAFRPSDVLTSRSGITVEIGNTDAEGRLILADALSLADEEKPEIIIDMATLTGAHRVALGWDLPGLFTNDDTLANSVLQHGEASGDPMWRLPLYKGYEPMLKSKVADTSSTGTKPLAGAITAALFLKKFVPETIKAGGSWVHIDFAGWTDARPGRPEGGEAHTIQALFAYLQERYGSQ